MNIMDYFKRKNSIPETTNTSLDHNGKVIAVCIDNYDRWYNKEEKRLQVGQQYTVEYIIIGRSWSNVYLKEIKNHLFGSALFEFYINGQKFSPIGVTRSLWQLSQPEMPTNSSRIFKYPSASDEALNFIREYYGNVPMIDCLSPLSEPELPLLPNIDSVIEYALSGWKLGETHGLPHWQRVERNGIILSTEICNGKMVFRKDINIKVVQHFAYLHDKCRKDNYEDLEHGARAADMIPTIRDTILKELTDKEVALLEKACRYHTTERCTGNPTIDVCFDADRLDLGRVGIVPNPKLMATKQGAYYATCTYRIENLEPFNIMYQDICKRQINKISSNIIKDMNTDSLLKRVFKMTKIEGGMMLTKNGDPMEIPTFYLTRLPITRSIWNAVMNEDKSNLFSRVEWEEYKEFIDRLNRIIGVKFVIPTGFQWKYASQCLTELDIYKDGIEVKLYDFKKGIWCERGRDFPYQLLCSMGNGHEAIKLFLATTDNIDNMELPNIEEVNELLQNVMIQKQKCKNAKDDYCRNESADTFSEGEF